MKTYGPGGYELQFSIVTPKTAYVLALAPLSWGLGFSAINGVAPTVMFQIGPIKMQVQRTYWQTN